MAQYPPLKITTAGLALIAQANASQKTLKFLKVAVGDGMLTSQNIATLNTVIQPKKEFPFTSGVKTSSSQFQLNFALSNSDIDTGFFAREIGVYAKIDGSSDSEAILVAYTNGGNFVDYIPAKDTPINSKIFEITVTVGDATNVTIQKADSAYVTVSEMERHNTDANAHGGLLQKVKTELSTHNTNISSHPAITNMIAKILGASDWQENPVATLKDIKNSIDADGIVAKKFGKIGYIKYASGLLIQWGKYKDTAENALRGAGNRNITVPLPLSFKNSDYSVIVSQISSHESHIDVLDWTESVLEKKVTTTNFIAQVDDYATGLFFICIGESI